MPPHTSPAALQTLAGLQALGGALGYSTAYEHEVARSGAAVDLAWFAARDRRVPLMIFEVESSASSSMANNATKVFAQDVDDFVKPLFFFHVLLGGGPDNERIALLRRAWGSYNYRVYRLSDDAELQRLVVDILGQHRRLSAAIELTQLYTGLVEPLWQKVDACRVFEAVENLEFEANYRRGLAWLAANDSAFQGLYATRIRSELVESATYPGSYDTVVGSYYSTLIEVSLVVGIGALPDELGADVLNRWQNEGWFGLKAIGPHFGLDRDYDQFVTGYAPFLFAIAAALCCHRHTKTWMVKELAALVDAEEEVGVPPAYTLPARIWLLHITASTLRHYSVDAIDGAEAITEAELVDLYNKTRTTLSLAKVPFDLVTSPPSPQAIVGEDAELLLVGELSGMRRLLDWPEWTDVSNGYFPAYDHQGWPSVPEGSAWRDPYIVSATVLLDDVWFTLSTNEVVSMLHRPRTSNKETALIRP